MDNERVARELVRIARDLIAANVPRPSFEGSHFSGAIGPKSVKLYEPIVAKVKKLLLSGGDSDRQKETWEKVLDDAMDETKRKYTFQIVNQIHTLSINSDDNDLSSAAYSAYKEMVKIAQDEGRQEYIDYVAGEIARKSGWKLKSTGARMNGSAELEKNGVEANISDIIRFKKGKLQVDVGDEMYVCKNIKMCLQVLEDVAGSRAASSTREAKVNKTPRTPLTDEFLDDGLAKYSNPPRRNKAVFLQFKGDNRGAMLELGRRPTKISPEAAVKEGIAYTVKGAWSWKRGTLWGEIVDAIWGFPY